MSETANNPSAAGDIRPVVRTADTGNRSLWIFGAVLLVGGLGLFQILNTRREELAVPQTQGRATDGAAITAPPPLALPADYAAAPIQPWPVFRGTRLAMAPSALLPGTRPPRVARVAAPATAITLPGAAAAPSALSPQPTIVFSNPSPAFAAVTPATSVPAPLPTTAPGSERVQARRLVNPAVTVPKGTIITAVLETALDSTRPGAARAIVSRDVMGYDGTRVLIPRGSRLYGSYGSDVSAGQKRALVQWEQLTRPDGVIINLDSPAADPLGRAGVQGKVDNHFLERFGSAIMQSILDIGVGIATREASDGVVVALPGSTQNITGANAAAQITPTLRVRQGASVSVFVARDLDFSGV